MLMILECEQCKTNFTHITPFRNVQTRRLCDSCLEDRKKVYRLKYRKLAKQKAI